ncbi:MAG: glycosyltransferase family 4 protein [Lacibacter sp.]
MRIAVNTRFLIPGKMEGFGYFIEEVFLRMASQHPEHEFYFLFDRPAATSFLFPPNVKCIVTGPQARHPLLWMLWYNLQIPRILRTIKADVFVSPDGFCSLTTSVPQCVVIHDIAFAHYPDFITKSHLWFYRRYTPLFVKKAKVIATVSEYSKEDLRKQYHVDPAKIRVIYSATNPIFQPVDWEKREAIKLELTSGTEYFLYTGTVHPRKNLIGLLKAFSKFKKMQKSNMKLVLVGRMTWKNETFKQLLQTFRFKDDVILTGYVSKEKLAEITAAAYALIYPSFFEGFGVPPLEALQCHVPAIVSEVSALPEIGGDAYLYINPNQVNDIAEKMMRLYKDESLREKLISNGKRQLQLYSWQRTADLLWDAILQTTQQG